MPANVTQFLCACKWYTSALLPRTFLFTIHANIFTCAPFLDPFPKVCVIPRPSFLLKSTAYALRCTGGCPPSLVAWTVLRSLTIFVSWTMAYPLASLPPHLPWARGAMFIHPLLSRALVFSTILISLSARSWSLDEPLFYRSLCLSGESGNWRLWSQKINI